MRKNFTFLLVLICAQFTLTAANGDSTIVRVFDKYHMNRYGNHDVKVKLAGTDKKYQRIWLKYSLGCLSNGQCEWDYTIKLFTRQRTGKKDSTARQAPYLKVNGTARDSVAFSTDTTWVNTFNMLTKTTDSTIAAILKITLFGDSLKPLTVTDSINAFTANYWRYWFDSTGKKTDSVWVPANQVIKQKNTLYYEVFEVINNIELGRFISPYAVNFPKTFNYEYVYDITDYVKYVTDSTELRIEYQGYSYGFTATWDMIYVEGTPAKEVVDVVNIYNGGFDYGQAVSIEQALKAKSFTVPAGTSATKARIIITGHGGESNQNCAEFCAKNMYLKLNNTQIAEQLVWKDDCGSNAIMAQPGTWVYNRANWCPGEKIRNYDYMLNVTAGSTNTIDLDMEAFSANGGASYNIALQLIYYKANSYNTDAAIEDIIAPTNAFWHNRSNPICDNGKILVKNWGAQPITSLEVTYQMGSAAPMVWGWSGNLPYEQETEVKLPFLLWPTDLTNRTFQVWLSKINGVATDDNSLNNKKTSTFDLPITLPQKFIIECRTNAVPAQNNYTLTNAAGEVLFTKNYTAANTMHRDTFNLGWGCYSFKFNDEGGNGLGWWAASSQGNGLLRIVEIGSPIKIIRTFGLDFGSFTHLNFRVQHPVGVDNQNLIDAETIKIYPNPAQDVIHIDGIEATHLKIFDLTGKLIKTDLTGNTIDVKDLGDGMYLLELTLNNGQVVAKKVSISK